MTASQLKSTLEALESSKRSLKNLKEGIVRVKIGKEYQNISEYLTEEIRSYLIKAEEIYLDSIVENLKENGIELEEEKENNFVPVNS